MGIRIIVGHEAGSKRACAVMFCSVDGRAFGPVFNATAYPDGSERDPHDTIEAFCAWLAARGVSDARKVSADTLDLLAAEWSLAGSP